MDARTLLFCTSYAGDAHTWAMRHERWLRHARACGIQYDRLIMVDDASPMVPDWRGVPVYDATHVPHAPARESIHRFPDRLGHAPGTDAAFPGWYRSFGHALEYAAREGFTRVLHIESDAYVLSKRAVTLFNTVGSGWTALWCNRYSWPESTLQIIEADSLPAARAFFARPYADHARAEAQPIERALPLTRVDRALLGDRYGEFLDYVPSDADFVSQVRWDKGEAYFWWSHPDEASSPMETNDETTGTPAARLLLAYGSTATGIEHPGADYRDFLSFLDERMRPEGFFEIGTHQGDSLAQFSCGALCVDPYFAFPGQVIGRRERLFLFQMTSDRFFAEHDPRAYLPSLDVAFLDGLHVYEALLRDFINFERHAHERSLAILHDCFPLNTRMTGREHLPGPASEDAATREFWTGDVWKVLPILQALRPDLTIVGVDCPPTGLVLIGGLDPSNTVLNAHFGQVVAHWAHPTLQTHGIRTLWESMPMLDSRRVMAEPEVFVEVFRVRD